MGFCRGYSFNTGDLTTCGDVLLNYLEAYESVPWDDLRYMFGEVSQFAHVCTVQLLACCCCLLFEQADC